METAKHERNQAKRGSVGAYIDKHGGCSLGLGEGNVPACTSTCNEIKELPWFQLVALSTPHIDTSHQLPESEEFCEPSSIPAIWVMVLFLVHRCLLGELPKDSKRIGLADSTIA